MERFLRRSFESTNVQSLVVILQAKNFRTEIPVDARHPDKWAEH